MWDGVVWRCMSAMRMMITCRGNWGVMGYMVGFVLFVLHQQLIGIKHSNRGEEQNPPLFTHTVVGRVQIILNNAKLLERNPTCANGGIHGTK